MSIISERKKWETNKKYFGKRRHVRVRLNPAFLFEIEVEVKKPVLVGEGLPEAPEIFNLRSTKTVEDLSTVPQTSGKITERYEFIFGNQTLEFVRKLPML